VIRPPPPCVGPADGSSPADSSTIRLAPRVESNHRKIFRDRQLAIEARRVEAAECHDIGRTDDRLRYFAKLRGKLAKRTPSTFVRVITSNSYDLRYSAAFQGIDTSSSALLSYE